MGPEIAIIAQVVAAAAGVGGLVMAATAPKPKSMKLPNNNNPIAPPEAPPPVTDEIGKAAGLESAQNRAARAGTSQLRIPSALGTQPGGGSGGLFLNLPR